MTRTEGKIKSFPKCISPPNNAYADWDAIYEELKETYKPAIDAKNVGYDDRTKMFMVSIDPGWNEWALIAYNQNRLALSLSSCNLELYGGSIAGNRPPLHVPAGSYPNGEDRPPQCGPAGGYPIGGDRKPQCGPAGGYPAGGYPIGEDRKPQCGPAGGYPHGAGYPQQSEYVIGCLRDDLRSISNKLNSLETNFCPPPGSCSGTGGWLSAACRRSLQVTAPKGNMVTQESEDAAAAETQPISTISADGDNV